MNVSLRLIVGASVFYMLFPALLFICGWVDWPFALAGMGIFVFLFFQQIRENQGKLCLGRNTSTSCLCAALLILLGWVLLSGVGGFWYQNNDFAFRNAMMEDLTRRPWPIIFPDGKVLIYYFASFLPSAFVGKFAGVNVGQFCLLLWSFLGVALSFIWLLGSLKTNRIFTILLIFIFWSGLDILLFGAKHLFEGSFYDYRVTGNTLNIFYGFHHVIPAILWAASLLHPRCSAKLSIVLFAGLLYTSPLEAIVAAFLLSIKTLNLFSCSYKNIKNKISQNLLSSACVCSILFSLSILSFLSINGTSGEEGRMGWNAFYTTPFHFVLVLALAIIPAWMGWQAGKRSLLYWSSLILLILLPLYQITGIINDFVNKGAVAVYFVLMFFFSKSYLHASKRSRRLIGSFYLAAASFAPLAAIADQLLMGGIKKHSVPAPTVLRNDLGDSLYRLHVTQDYSKLGIPPREIDWRCMVGDSASLPPWFYKRPGEAQQVWMRYIGLEQENSYPNDTDCSWFRPRQSWQFPKSWRE